jgi:hypothetical protein
MRLRYNGCAGTLGAAHNDSTTTLTLASKLTYVGGDVPTIAAGDYLPLSILDADGLCAEVVYVTAYTEDATTATVRRGQEDSVPVSHSDGATFVHGPTRFDFAPELLFPVTVDYSTAGFNGIFDAISRGRAGQISAPYGLAMPCDADAGTPFAVPAAFASLGYKVTVSQNSNVDGTRLAFRALDRNNTTSGNAAQGGESHTGGGADQWWKVDFGSGYEFTPTRLGILGRSTSGYHPRNFKLQGSANDSTWTDLLTVSADGPTDNAWWTSAVSGSAAYRYIRIITTGNNSSSDTHLVMGALEMWGTLDES